MLGGSLIASTTRRTWGRFPGTFSRADWLHKYELLPAIALAVLCFAVAGWSGLVVGYFWSTVLVYHGTFCINSLAHAWAQAICHR
jgi:fatty-acid desaturase